MAQTRLHEAAVAEALTDALGVRFESGKFPLGSWGTGDRFASLGQDITLVLEVERSQSHPSTNVLKYWPWLEANSGERVLLIHAFSLSSRALGSSRERLAEWVGRRMEEHLPSRFLYRRIVCDAPEFDEQCTDLRTLIASLWSTQLSDRV